MLFRSLLDYKPVADEFDKKAVKKLLTDLKESDPYLFTEAADNGKGVKGKAVSQEVSGLGGAWGRGSQPNPMETEVLSDENLRDPQFMSNYHSRQRETKK